jgi:hypothetical protein
MDIQLELSRVSKAINCFLEINATRRVALSPVGAEPPLRDLIVRQRELTSEIRKVIVLARDTVESSRALLRALDSAGGLNCGNNLSAGTKLDSDSGKETYR